MQTPITAIFNQSVIFYAGLFSLAMMIALLAQTGRADPVAETFNTTDTGLGAALGMRIEMIDSELYMNRQILSSSGHQAAQVDPLLDPRMNTMSATIFQNGQNNQLSLQTEGHSNLVTIRQNGAGNRVDAAISGHNNQAIIAQIGRLNSAQFTQSGVMNSVSIQQGTW